MNSYSPLTSAYHDFISLCCPLPTTVFVQAEDPKYLYPVFIQKQFCNFELFLQPFHVRLIFPQHLLLSFLFHTWGTRCSFNTSSSIRNLCSVSELWGGRKSYSKCCFHAKRCLFGMVWCFLFCFVLDLFVCFWVSLLQILFCLGRA